VNLLIFFESLNLTLIYLKVFQVLLLPNFQRTFNYIKFSLPLFSPHLLVIYFVIFAPDLPLFSFFASHLFDSGCKGKSFFLFTKSFSLFLFLFFLSKSKILSDFFVILYRLSSFSLPRFVTGCKGKSFIHITKSFFTFSLSFLSFFLRAIFSELFSFSSLAFSSFSLPHFVRGCKGKRINFPTKSILCFLHLF
jgi:hypothetical protein